MTNLQIFNNDRFGQVRIVPVDGELMFVAKDYVDKILSSKSCLTITQIAADYGMSAQELNKILHEAGLQRKVGDQWILYKQHMSKGFTKSETFTFCRSDGRLDSKITTKWTQKGRLEIHNILSNLDIHAVCENVA
jgi:phage antirepressor YoqD-like protein